MSHDIFFKLHWAKALTILIRMNSSYIIHMLKPNITSLGYALFLAISAAGIWGGVFPFLPMEFQTKDIVFWFYFFPITRMHLHLFCKPYWRIQVAPFHKKLSSKASRRAILPRMDMPHSGDIPK